MVNFNEIVERKNTRCVKWDRFSLEDENRLPMWIADTDFKAPKEVIDALEKSVKHGVFGYTFSTDSSYDAVIQWLSRRHQWHIQKESILFCNGVVPSIAAIIPALTNERDAIVVQPPIYPPFINLTKRHNRKLILNELVLKNGRYEIDFEQLETCFREEQPKLFIFCSPHNPVGRVWTREELEKVAALCEQYNVIILSDEIHHDIVFENHTHTPTALLSPEAKERTITCVAPSKTFNIAGLQASAIIIENKALRDKVQKQLLNQGFYSINSLGLDAFEAAYTYGDEWIDEMNEYVLENVNYMREFFSKHFPECTWIQPEGTYLVWLNLSPWFQNDENIKECIEEEVALVLEDGHNFGRGGAEFVRFNAGCPRSYIKEALHRLEHVRSRHYSFVDQA